MSSVLLPMMRLENPTFVTTDRNVMWSIIRLLHENGDDFLKLLQFLVPSLDFITQNSDHAKSHGTAELTGKFLN